MIKKLIPFTVSVAILIVCIVFFSLYPSNADNTAVLMTDDIRESSNAKSENKTISNTDDKTEDFKEMRGIWIPYMSLNLSENERGEEKFKEKIDGIISDCIKYKANTIIVQVRPFGDAIYPSEYFPFSHIISGTQGKSVDYDPLKYIISKAHENGLDVHAWLNLLRIKTNTIPSELSKDNPYIKWKSNDNKKDDEYTFEYNGGIYYNPACEEVRRLIINGVKEILRKYDVDGIQFDDYFYPSDDFYCDKNSYNRYCDSIEDNFVPLSQAEWRIANINTLVSGIYSAVHNTKDNVLFGISPQGNIENDILMGADIYKWCSTEGYVDYICPQIYVSNEHPVLPFYNTAKRWCEIIKSNNIKLYFGLGIYKAGTDADNGTWFLSDDNIKKQIEYSRELKTDGFMLYSYEYLNKNETEKEVKNAMAIIE